MYLVRSVMLGRKMTRYVRLQSSLMTLHCDGNRLCRRLHGSVRLSAFSFSSKLPKANSILSELGGGAQVEGRYSDGMYVTVLGSSGSSVLSFFLVCEVEMKTWL